MGTEIRGRRAICEHVKRAWPTVQMLHKSKKFPMEKVGGVWVSDTDLIKDWNVKQLQRR